MKRQGNLGHHSKVCNFFSFTGQAQSIHQSSTKSHSNGQYCYPVKFGKNGRYSKQISNCFEQNNMGFFVEQRDHSYCIMSYRVTQCGDRYLVQDNKGCKRVKVKCQNIPKDSKHKAKSERDLFASCISCQLPTYISWKLDPYSQGRDAFQISWTNENVYAFPLFCLISRVLKKINLVQATQIAATPGWQSALVPSFSANVYKEILFTSNYFKYFDRAKQKNHQLIEKQNL